MEGPIILVPPELDQNHIHSKIQLIRPVGSGRGQKLPLHFFTKVGAVVTVLPWGYCSGHRAARQPSEPQETSLVLERAGQSAMPQYFWVHGITGSQIFFPQEPGETNFPP